jgi:hypothetical protein
MPNHSLPISTKYFPDGIMKLTILLFTTLVAADHSRSSNAPSNYLPQVPFSSHITPDISTPKR